MNCDLMTPKMTHKINKLFSWLNKLLVERRKETKKNDGKCQRQMCRKYVCTV